MLAKSGIDVKGRSTSQSRSSHLSVSSRTRQTAESARGASKISTTSRSINPLTKTRWPAAACACDLLDPALFREKAARVVAKNRLAKGAYGATPFSMKRRNAETGERSVATSASSLNWSTTRAQEGKSVLEGAQGTMLDIDPRVAPIRTSPAPAPRPAEPQRAGVPPTKIKHVLGISRLIRRVGGGPFPTEMPDLEAPKSANGKDLTITGRPRRCGWLIGRPRYAKMINGIDCLLSQARRLTPSAKFRSAPDTDTKASPSTKCPPSRKSTSTYYEYKTLPGWCQDTYGVKDAALPKAASTISASSATSCKPNGMTPPAPNATHHHP